MRSLSVSRRLSFSLIFSSLACKDLASGTPECAKGATTVRKFPSCVLTNADVISPLRRQLLLPSLPRQRPERRLLLRPQSLQGNREEKRREKEGERRER